MTPFELGALRSEMIVQGVNYVPLQMPTPNFKGVYPTRVRTPFGLCKWYVSNSPEKIVIFVTAHQIEKVLKEMLKQESANSEAGKTER